MSGQPIPAVVRDVIVAVATANHDAVAALATYQQVGCTTAPGLGGPPKCGPGDAAGTAYAVFPTGACESEWSVDAGAALAALLRQPLALYGAVTVQAPTPDPEPYWPKGQYAVLFKVNAGAEAPPSGVYFILSPAGIVRAHAMCGSGPGAETELLRGVGASGFLVPPPERELR
ncbi:MAG: hypothetical protein EXR68_03595 [Dehalococcoidia bacterium]|nr:hypothetical protein [Dehalococcoidia bacterium]